MARPTLRATLPRGLGYKPILKLRSDMNKTKKSIIHNVEELSRQLKRLRSIQQDFRFPSEMSTNDAYCLLYTSLRIEVERTGHKLKTTDSATNAVSAMAHYLTLRGRSVKTGFLLCGTPGNGKTSLLYALQSAIEWMRHAGLFSTAYGQYDMDNLQIVSAKTLVAESGKAGLIEQYKRKPLLGIDDMGNEPGEILSYGNALTPLVDVIEARYNARLFTVITTNLTGQQIREKYGARIADRLNEMMCIVVYKDDTFR